MFKVCSFIYYNEWLDVFCCIRVSFALKLMLWPKTVDSTDYMLNNLRPPPQIMAMPPPQVMAMPPPQIMAMPLLK